MHVWLAVYGKSPDLLEASCQGLLALVEQTGGGRTIGQQDAAALVIDGKPTAKEHFGYTDGFANPDYVGVDRDKQPGQGKINKQGKMNPDGTWSQWTELAAGELLLGHADEADELPVAPVPHLLGDNGTFMVYRKLHQNVKSFRDYLASQGAKYSGGPQKLAAKFVGRWQDGTPIELSPDGENSAIVADKKRNVNFTFGEDLPAPDAP